MPRTHQTILAAALFAAAILLLARQLYRMYKGKVGGCSCTRLPRENNDDQTNETP